LRECGQVVFTGRLARGPLRLIAESQMKPLTSRVALALADSFGVKK
jgi:hypothetical protein